ncbi:MAG TPA: acyl-CoA dehydrogenase family protein [Myxococcota bacterium]|nr:acyl-CoA dehydrogenase family protein [Myxococcota bacterium]
MSTAAKIARIADGPSKVRAVADVAAAEAAASERARTLTPRLVEAMWEAGLMSHMNPAEARGTEPGFRDMIETWIAMAAIDGSFGWTGLANFSATAASAAYLPEAGFAEVFGRGACVVVAGQYAPNGQGAFVDGGIRLTGNYSFGSGTGHSAYIAAGYLPIRDGELQWEAPGVPELRVAIVPRTEVTFTDGWHVQGLKGTGSYDYQLRDLFVPAHRTYALFATEPHRGRSPAFRMGLMPITAAGHAAWALGVAKSMLDDVEQLAATKVRMGDLATLANRASFQQGLAHHAAMWRAARLLVLDAFEGAERAVAAREALTPVMRADLRVAAVYATHAARVVGEWAHLAAGTTAIREGSRLERAFRDLYTGTQHVFINEKVAAEAAQVWLGLVADHRHL